MGVLERLLRRTAGDVVTFTTRSTGWPTCGLPGLTSIARRNAPVDVTGALPLGVARPASGDARTTADGAALPCASALVLGGELLGGRVGRDRARARGGRASARRADRPGAGGAVASFTSASHARARTSRRRASRGHFASASFVRSRTLSPGRVVEALPSGARPPRARPRRRASPATTRSARGASAGTPPRS